MHLIKTKIISNIRLNNFYKITLESSLITKDAIAGQFLLVRCDAPGAILKRPFSIHRLEKGKIEILYKIVGKGTLWLSQRNPNEELEILGPCGNGYPLPKRYNNKPLLLVAGGSGVASFPFLIQSLPSNFPFVLLIGAKNKQEIIDSKEFHFKQATVKISTEDGSLGEKGLVSRLLEKELANRKDFESIYACGPRIMLEKVAKLAFQYKINCFLSLEERMGCGIGACHGCVVNTKQGYQRVCKDGPIFKSDEIIF